jgi:hypothetical protein
MVPTDPLTPAMELEPGMGLMAWQLRITNEPEMGLIAKVGKGIDQTVNATGKAAGVGIGVGAFKRKDVELHGGPFHLWRLNSSMAS